MLKPDPVTTCLCCARDIPSHNYAHNSVICHHCTVLTPSQIALTTHASLTAKHKYETFTAAGKRETKRLAKLASMATTGKRCASCHGHKPIEAYGNCRPHADGLQPNCKECNKIRLTILQSAAGQPGALARWHQVQDALRAQNDIK